MEIALAGLGHRVRVIEDCLNGRRTVWEDPFKPGRNGLRGVEQRIEMHSPLALVMVFLGTNDFQSMHPLNAWQSAQGVAAIVGAIRRAPIEPGMPVPPVMVIAPPVPTIAKGAMSEKFAGAAAKAVGLAAALRQVADENRCAFFDAGTLVAPSPIDGVHLDAAEHLQLGRALAAQVAALLVDRAASV